MNFFFIIFLLQNLIKQYYESLIFTICIFFANCVLVKESRVICWYNYNWVSKVYYSAYFDNEDNVFYAMTFEEYVKVLRPTWYGVSWCDNSTMAINIGIY